MKLFSRVLGEGRPLVILHGLFGSGDNWLSAASKLPGWEIHLPDIRNHGSSPWSPSFSINDIAEDLLEYIHFNNLKAPVLMGHSLGAKAAMETVLREPTLASGLVAVDMSPKAYAPKYPAFVSAMASLDLDSLNSRSDALGILEQTTKDRPTAQFLLKNLVQDETGLWKWRLNLEALKNNYDEIWKSLALGRRYLSPAFFIHGGASDYLVEDDKPMIKDLFPSVTFESIPGAGHWLHAEKPQEFFTLLQKSLNSLEAAQS